ncbi:hypothetical protein [Streptomyces chartreusis]|uniref:hypothetical protein n=1 Tax=Streptomyces chartreusis TaxID=1969 RepID=UPI0035DF0F43
MANGSDAEANRNGADSTPKGKERWVALAALGGSLIGALTGLTGSLLVYNQAEDARRQSELRRTSDIRRSAYNGLVVSSRAYRTEALSTVNLIGLEEYDKQHNDKYVPADTKLEQAESLARLVGTESARTLIRKMTKLREQVNRLIAQDYIDVEKCYATMSEHAKVVDKFVEKIDTEVI